MNKIIQRIKQETSVAPGSIHGEGHWLRVAEFGKYIADKEGLNKHFILLFVYFHDCMRYNDSIDPNHGLRAAEYLKTFKLDDLKINEDERSRLMFACEYHTYEKKTEDKDILACWDSDRLDLPRVGIAVDPKRLFTETAKQILKFGVKNDSNFVTSM